MKFISQFDQTYDPQNLIDNILKKDDSVYKSVSPTIDLMLNDGGYFFFCEVVIQCGNPPPGMIEVYASNTENWTLVNCYNMGEGKELTLNIPGEQIAKFLRLRFTKNARGGSLVSIKHIAVKGIKKEVVI